VVTLARRTSAGASPTTTTRTKLDDQPADDVIAAATPLPDDLEPLFFPRFHVLEKFGGRMNALMSARQREDSITGG